MKIGVSLYSFHAYAGEDSLGMKGCIAKAKEIGCEGVDFVETQHESQEAYLAHAREIGAYCREMGVEAVCFCVGSDFLNGAAAMWMLKSPESRAGWTSPPLTAAS